MAAVLAGAAAVLEAGAAAGAELAAGAGVDAGFAAGAELAAGAVDAGFAAGAGLAAGAEDAGFAAAALEAGVELAGAELGFAGAAADVEVLEAASAFLLFDDFLLAPEVAAVELAPEAGAAAASLFALFVFEDFDVVLEDVSEDDLSADAAPDAVEELSPAFFDFLDFLLVVEVEVEL